MMSGSSPDPADAPFGTGIDATEDAGRFAPAHRSETARDGAPARRPGDPDPAPDPAARPAPLFSTDPLTD